MNRNLHVSGLYVPGGHPHRTYSYITAEKRGVQPALQPQEPGEELLPDKRYPYLLPICCTLLSNFSVFS